MRLVVSVVLLAISMCAAGQDLDVQPVKVTAILADQQTSAKGYLRLMAKKDLSMTILAGDLKTTTGETIPRNAISLPGDATLKKGQPKDLLIQIDGIRQTGTYEGVFDLYVVDPQQHDATAVHQTAPVAVTVFATPKLALVGTQPIVWTVVHCSNRVTCLVVDKLLPSSMRSDHKSLVVEDQRSATTSIDAQLLTTTANGTEAQASVAAQQDPKESRGNRYRATATFKRDDLVPGVYPAVVELKPHDRGDALSQPVTLDVRVGPFVSLLAIIAGVIVGRLSQMLATPLFQFQSNLLSRVYQIKGEAEAVADASLKAVILERLKNAIDRIQLASAAEGTITTDVEAIAAQTIASLRFDRLMAVVANVADTTKRSALQTRADEIRKLILKGQVKDAEGALDTAEIDAGAPRVWRALGLGQSPTAGSEAKVEQPKASLLVRTLSALAGTHGPAPARVKYAVIKPALFFLLLVVLCLTGFNTLYVKAAGGFGSAGLFDQLGLFMWGLTADVAQGTLQRLPK